jgi:hypothetical protein
MTGYDADYIGEAAIWGLLQAKKSGERNLSKAITDELVDMAISKLPECGSPAPEGEPKPLPLADYVRQREPRVLRAIEEFAGGVEERGGDSDIVLEKLEVEIGRIRRSRLKTRGSRRPPVDEERRQREMDEPPWGDKGGRPDFPADSDAPPADADGDGSDEGQGGDGIVPPVTEVPGNNEALSEGTCWLGRSATRAPGGPSSHYTRPPPTPPAPAVSPTAADPASTRAPRAA